MSSQNPLVIDLDESIHRALQLRAAKDGLSPAEVVQTLLRKALGAEIEEVSGVPPLAAMIQNHHDHEQRASRSQNKATKVQHR
jgi:plasmid stability protein